MKKILCLFFLILTFYSCDDDLINNQIPVDAQIRSIIFNYGASNFNSFVSDEITIKKIQIIKDVLVIDVTYGGGCETHSFVLYSSSSFLESFPVQLQMKLYHNSNMDYCKMQISEKLYFDLRSVEALYEQYYRTDKGVVLLSVYGSDSTEFFSPKPRYEF